MSGGEYGGDGAAQADSMGYGGQDEREAREELSRRERRRRQQLQERGKREAMPEWLQAATGTLPMLLVSVLATAGMMYYARSKMPSKPPALKGITTSLVIDANIKHVYDYLSTPDFRTEYHMGSMEVTGPAIDHSAHVGELFVEELVLDDEPAIVDWVVIDREFPSSDKSARASFGVEGKTKFKGKILHLHEIFRIRAGLHQFAKTPQVHIEMEVLVDGGSKGGLNGNDDASKRWRRSLKQSMKDTLSLMRSRVEEEEKRLLAVQQEEEAQARARKAEKNASAQKEKMASAEKEKKANAEQEKEKAKKGGAEKDKKGKDKKKAKK